MIERRKGSYVLVFESAAEHAVTVGAMGEVAIRPGYYLYIGSAFGAGGVHARVSRHLRVDKKMHWHIDYVRPFLHPVAVWGSYDAERREHQWAQMIGAWAGVQIPVARFGASDCACASHFFWLAKPAGADYACRIFAPTSCPYVVPYC